MTTIYFQMYDATVYMCLAAEACYRFESGEYNAKFIQAGGWNNLYKGLCVGEQLKLNLQQMEVARSQRYERFLEIDKRILMSELFEESEWPKILEKLKKTGEIQFEFPERIFAQNYPGHYYRQIYYMHTSMIKPKDVDHIKEEIHIVLTQTSNAIVLTEDNDVVDYLFKESSARPSASSLLTNIRSGQQIAISKTIEDFGVDGIKGEMLLVDQDRYDPFEGTGVISKWHLEFADEHRRVEFLKDLTDISFILRYTSIPGSPQFTEYVKSKLKK